MRGPHDFEGARTITGEGQLDQEKHFLIEAPSVKNTTGLDNLVEFLVESQGVSGFRQPTSPK